MRLGRPNRHVGSSFVEYAPRILYSDWPEESAETPIRPETNASDLRVRLQMSCSTDRLILDYWSS
jgi:hypothetical protein